MLKFTVQNRRHQQQQSVAEAATGEGKTEEISSGSGGAEGIDRGKECKKKGDKVRKINEEKNNNEESRKEKEKEEKVNTGTTQCK